MKNLDKLALLISKPEHFEYFFKKVGKPELFDWLNNKIHSFDYIPEPELTDDGQSIRFIPWWPGKYLIKVSAKIPDKVLSVLQKVNTNNYFALNDCAKAILNMPDDFLAKNSDLLLDLFDRWLNSKYIGSLPKRALDLLKKYIDSSNFIPAYELFDILSIPKVNKRGDTGFRFKTYYYKKILKEILPQLIEKDPLMVLKIIEKRLREAINQKFKGNKRSNHSIVWRPIIEESSQNWRFDDPKDIFLEILRDTLYQIVQVDREVAKKVIEKYLKEEFSIFRRLGIHIIRVCDYDDLARNLLISKDNLDNRYIHHEFFKLMKYKFCVLRSDEKKQFVLRIVEVSPEEIFTEGNKDQINSYIRRWQTNRLYMIKKYLEIDEDLVEFRYLLKEYRDKFNKTDRKGPTSTLSKDEIIRISIEEFIEWVKNNLQPPYEMMGPSPEEVSRIFQEVVKENPTPYALAAEKFIDDRIWPAYLYGFIRGLEEAIKEGKRFDLNAVLNFIENSLKFCEEPIVQSQHDKFDIGQYSWFRGAIANFIETLSIENEFELSQDIMDRTQRVLIDLIKNDPHPSEEDEKKFGPEANNMDYVTYCINSNRGKAMHALMQHALRRAQMRPEVDKKREEGKGPFPPGKRMGVYEEFFKRRLDGEISPSVQSSYGQFLPYLFYLDRDWVKEMKKQNKLFPQINIRAKFWEAHWEGYIGFNEFNDQIYDLLIKEYKRAICLLNVREDNRKHCHYSDENLTEHLMIAYWKGLEEIEEKDTILREFFKRAHVDIRSYAIRFLSSIIEEVKPKKNSKEWQRLKALWDYRVRESKDSELAHFVKWLKYCPENLDNIINLIEPLIPYLHMEYQEEVLLEYIYEKIETNTRNALTLLNDLFKMKESILNIHFKLDLVKKILVKARKYKDIQGISQIINQAINRLGEVGYYDFRDLLV